MLFNRKTIAFANSAKLEIRKQFPTRLETIIIWTLLSWKIPETCWAGAAQSLRSRLKRVKNVYYIRVSWHFHGKCSEELSFLLSLDHTFTASTCHATYIGSIHLNSLGRIAKVGKPTYHTLQVPRSRVKGRNIKGKKISKRYISS